MSPSSKSMRKNEFGDHVVRRRRIVIPNKHGENLVGILHETGSKELVVVCHGFRSSKERIPMMTLANALEKEGISAFSFDFAGNGESEGSFQYGNYRREADDLQNVVQHFLEQKRVIGAIVGHSKGGNVVLMYASKYSDISTIINISGRFKPERGMEVRFVKDFLQRIEKDRFIDVKNRKGEFLYRVTAESLMDRLSIDTKAACEMLSKQCRVLTVHGSADKIVLVEEALEFAEFIPNHVLRLIEGADHEYTCHQDELASVVIDFIKASRLLCTDAAGNSPIASKILRHMLCDIGKIILNESVDIDSTKRYKHAIKCLNSDPLLITMF